MSLSILFHYFDDLSTKQQEQFKKIGDIYKIWNTKLNLISRKDIDQLYLKHVLYSLSIAQIIDFCPGTKVLDVGTGGGFPGIPLAIKLPQVQFHLIDSIGKKVKAVQCIAQELGLTNVSITQTRAENVKEQYDFILGRAVTNLPTFYHWVQENIAQATRNRVPNGILYLKGDEPISMPFQHHIYPIKHLFDEPFFRTKQLVHLIKGA